MLTLQEKEELQPVQGKEWEKLVWDSVLDGEFWVKCVLSVEEMKDVLQLQSTLIIFLFLAPLHLFASYFARLWYVPS